MIPQAANAIETLINLAQQGEIDPWDVQVIEVVDRFLNELESTKDNQSTKIRASFFMGIYASSFQS